MRDTCGVLLVGLTTFLLGCGPTDELGEAVDTTEQGLQCAAQWKTQYDGTTCGRTSGPLTSICGPTSAAMMRHAMTCGQCSPRGGDVRAWYDQVNGITGACCTRATGTCVVGADAHLIYRTMAHDNHDGCPVYEVADKCYAGSAGYTIDDLKRDLSAARGYVAVVSGQFRKGSALQAHCCSCWYASAPDPFAHSIYVHSYDPATDRFSVYDPDARCNSGHRQATPSTWTSADLNAFSGGFYHGNSRYLCVLLGRGPQSADCGRLPRPPSPPPESPGEGLDFACGNSLRDAGTGTGDWSSGFYKAQCSGAQAATGLSMSMTSPGYAHDLLCRLDDGTVFQHASCRAVVFGPADNRGTSATGDWDPGSAKGECAADEYAAGTSQSTDLRLHALWCCKGRVQHTECAALAFDGQDAQERPANDWDPGFWKGECGPDRFVAGVSQRAGVPHALLCCGTRLADAGSPADDAGSASDDAGTSDGGPAAGDDAGQPQAAPPPPAGAEPLAGGCGCTHLPPAEAGALLAAALAWLAGARRIRRDPPRRRG